MKRTASTHLKQEKRQEFSWKNIILETNCNETVSDYNDNNDGNSDNDVVSDNCKKTYYDYNNYNDKS